MNIGHQHAPVDVVNTHQKARVPSFWKIYAIVMAVDLLIYILIFHAGKAIPPASPTTSFPGNTGLVIYWLQAHMPASLIFLKNPTLPESLISLLILQDAWLAGLIYLWKRRTRS